MSNAFARQAWHYLSTSFPLLLDSPLDIQLRYNMQLGAYLSGMAIEASMLGAAHALANPLTARFGVPHGQAVGVMMPHVIRANAKTAEVHDAYRELMRSMHGSDIQQPEELADWFQALVNKAQLQTTLASLSVPETALAALAADALTQWTLKHNPVDFDEASVLEIYRRAWT